MTLMPDSDAKDAGLQEPQGLNLGYCAQQGQAGDGIGCMYLTGETMRVAIAENDEAWRTLMSFPVKRASERPACSHSPARLTSLDADQLGRVNIPGAGEPLLEIVVAYA